jgi:hypothetical protein
MTEIEEQLLLLGRYGVACVIVGGVAATLHGSSFLTHDLDVCYAREPANLERLALALRSVNARLRGAPQDLPFLLDAETLRRGLNFTFQTDIGPIDLLGEVAGVGQFAEACAHAVLYQLFGHQFAVLSLDKLIASKRAAGRPKDLLVLPELEAIYEYQQLNPEGEKQPPE